jgi:hypothetical protein
MGALVQSTSAAAGLLAGLVVSSLLAVAPAAVAFLGAQIGAAAAPLLVTGLIDLRVGLIVVAVGILWLGLATDRRATALGRLVLGAGLISFGLQTMRPGFEPFVSNPALLPVLNRLQADSIPGVLTCALLGAMLAALQGPAPVLVLVLGISQTTGHWDLRTALAVLSGSGLGAALGALFTIPAGPRCRRLAQLYLVLGLGSTLIAAATVDVWCQLADRLMAGSPHEIRWGKRVVLPNLGRHLSAAFAFSQLAVALVLLPFVGIISRFLERIWPEAVESTRVRPGAATAAARDGLLVVVRTQRAAITPIAELALTGMRAAGRAAEHELADAEASLRGLLAGPVRALPATPPGQVLARTSFACLQLQRALEGLLRQAERLTDTRVASAGARDVPPLPPDDEAIVLEMQALFSEGLAALGTGLETGAEVDLEAARAREIRMNGLEARARDALLAADREPAAVARHLAVLELVDAYETAGNQVYRLAEALGESYTQTHVAAI